MPTSRTTPLASLYGSQPSSGLGKLGFAIGAGPGLAAMAQQQEAATLGDIYAKQALGRKAMAEAGIDEDRAAARGGLGDYFRNAQTAGMLPANLDPVALATAARAADKLSLPDFATFGNKVNDDARINAALQAYEKGDPQTSNVLLEAGGRSPIKYTDVSGGMSFNPNVPGSGTVNPIGAADIAAKNANAFQSRASGQAALTNAETNRAKLALQPGIMTEGLPSVPLDQDGGPNAAAQQAFLGNLDPATASLVKGITEYRIPIDKVTSLRGNERQRLAQIIAQYDPTFDMSQYPARAAMRKSITSGNYSQALNAANLVIQHLAALQQAGDDLHNTRVPLFNAISNTVAQETGNPSISRFNTARNAAASELAKVFKGTGVASEQEISDWLRNLNINSSPAQLKASIDTAIGDLLKSRIDTIRQQFRSTMGRPADFTFLTPKSAQVLQGLGIDPASIDPRVQIQSAPAAQPAAPAMPAQPPAGNTTSTGIQWRVVQ